MEMEPESRQGVCEEVLFKSTKRFYKESLVEFNNLTLAKDIEDRELSHKKTKDVCFTFPGLP